MEQTTDDALRAPLQYIARLKRPPSARLVTEAAGVAQGVRRESGERLPLPQMERSVADPDLVKREEFDVVRDLASKESVENDKLATRVGELEA